MCKARTVIFLASILEILGINLGAFLRVRSLLFEHFVASCGPLGPRKVPKAKTKWRNQKLVKKLGSS